MSKLRGRCRYGPFPPDLLPNGSPPTQPTGPRSEQPIDFAVPDEFSAPMCHAMSALLVRAFKQCGGTNECSNAATHHIGDDMADGPLKTERQLTADIVAAFARHNQVPSDQLVGLIRSSSNSLGAGQAGGRGCRTDASSNHPQIGSSGLCHLHRMRLARVDAAAACVQPLMG
jgi:hypothetical protein